VAIKKQTFEAFFVSGSILKVQKGGEAVVLGTSEVFAWDKDLANVTSTFLVLSSKKLDTDPEGDNENNMLSIQVRNGDPALSPYLVTFYMVTTNGNKWEADVQVKVKETGPTHP
jgi:hypothetical protein